MGFFGSFCVFIWEIMLTNEGKMKQSNQSDLYSLIYVEYNKWSC